MEIGYGIYVKNSAEAVPFYMEAFGLELGYHVKNADGSYFHSSLLKDGREALSVVESRDEMTHNNIVNLGVTLPDEAAVRRAFAMLADGGRVILPLGSLPWSAFCAEVVDRFGVWWYLTVPQRSPGDDFDPDTFDHPLSPVDKSK